METNRLISSVLYQPWKLILVHSASKTTSHNLSIAMDSQPAIASF